MALSRQAVLGLCRDSDPNCYGLLRAGKVGWSASVLYRLTGEQKCSDLQSRLAITLSHNDGSWSAMGSDEPNDDSIVEMVVWKNEANQEAGRG